jgi:hypothetical protein
MDMAGDEHLVGRVVDVGLERDRPILSDLDLRVALGRRC